jgi:hypothetical protein
MYPRLITCRLALSVMLFSSLALQAQNPYQISQTLLQATTTNLNGSGIVVAQPEADYGNTNLSTFEVSPAFVNQPTNLFTYISTVGSATGFTNDVGLESNHADGVANIFYGLPNGLSTNIAHVYNYDANCYISHHIFNLNRANGESVVNQSFAFDPPLALTNQIPYDSAWDDFEETYHTLFATAAGNASVVECPGTAYNVISVGCFYGPYLTNNYANGIGPTMDNGRCKPDITAIGTDTSETAPQVAGAAAILMQAALRGDGGPDTNSAFNDRTVKALLLNGAVKPFGWTNSPVFPLDARYGAGVLNVFNSYRLLVGGKHGSIVSNLVSSGSVHPPLAVTAAEPVLNGWDFNTNISSSSPARDAIYHYYFNVTNNLPGTKFAGAATLVWNRQLNQTSINNLDLFLYNCANSNLVACSTSLVDNVEHICLTNLAQGRYDLQVWKQGGAGIVSTTEPYALAWQFFSDNLGISGSGTNSNLTWPLYPAGFLVQTTTNLTSGTWTNLDLTALVFTNNMNSLPLNPANANQFFRLCTPNFYLQSF